MASFLSKIWFPEVITSMPELKSCSQREGVTEKPPARFSAFITARSILYCSRRSCMRSSTAKRPGLATTSPIIRIFIARVYYCLKQMSKVQRPLGRNDVGFWTLDLELISEMFLLEEGNPQWSFRS